MISFSYQRVRLCIRAHGSTCSSSLRAADSSVRRERQLLTFYKRLHQRKTKSNTGQMGASLIATYQYQTLQTSLRHSMLASSLRMTSMCHITRLNVTKQPLSSTGAQSHHCRFSKYQ
uniref:Uncharacterized protein n=1 Tax=Rhizophora mucronata TaxID=61149 RepID=A0A2P2IMB4_RHIMU